MAGNERRFEHLGGRHFIGVGHLRWDYWGSGLRLALE